MYIIKEFRDVEDLKYRIASNPDVISNLARFANMLGFGWCGGTQTGTVGTGFDVSKNGDTYVMQAHYDKNDPHAEGFWADKRLKITLLNFRLLIDSSTLQYGKPRISSLDPLAVSTFTAINSSNSEDSISKTFTYQLSNTVSHTTTFSFTEGMKVSVKWEAKIPFFGGGETTTEFSFSSTQGWSDTTSTTYGSTDAQQYNGKVPAKSKRLIKLVVLRTQSEISYAAQAVVAFDVKFDGFLRWSGNARKDHPRDRPFVTASFGNDTMSAFEDIVDKYNHRDIPNYSDWDWSWMQSKFGNSIGSVIDFSKNGIGVTLNGKFKDVKGTDAHIEAESPQPLSRTELDDYSKVNNIELIPTINANVLSRHVGVPSHLILETDEYVGGRVVLVD